MTEMELQRQKLRQDAEIAEKDRQQRHRDMVTKAVIDTATTLATGGLSMAGKLAVGGAKAAINKGSKNKSKTRGFSGKEGRAAKIGGLYGANSPEWYNKNSALVRDAANISFSTPIGCSSSSKIKYMSGIMRLDVDCVLPHDTSDTDTLVSPQVLQAFRSQYARIRKANSGAKNYEFTDLAKYALAIQSIYNLIASARRAYMLARKFDAHNRFVGDQLLRASGWNESIRGNLAQLRERINYYQMMIKSFALPDIMTVVQRQTWLFSNVFRDDNILRSQLYVFCNHGHYELMTEDSKSGLHYYINGVSSNDGYLLDYNTFVNDMDRALKLLQNDPYSGIISGDIQKEYGENAYLSLFNDLGIDDTFDFVYSPEVLTQINGAVITGSSTPNGTPSSERVMDVVFDTYASTNEPLLSQILYGNNINTSATINAENEIVVPYCINMYKDDVTPDDVMVATRLGAVQKIHKLEQGYEIRTVACGTEIISNAKIFVYNKPENKFESMNLACSCTPVAELTPQNLVYKLQFDWAPKYMEFKYTTAATVFKEGEFPGFFEDIANYAFIDSDIMSRLHVVAAISLYGLLF